MRSRLSGLDLFSYVRAFGLLARNPSLLLAPLLTAVIGVVVGQLSPHSGDPIGSLTSGLSGFIVFLLDSFGLGVSLVIADYVWRRGRASFDDGWSEARRKGGDILLAAIGFNFIVVIAALAGNLVGGGLIAYLLVAAAIYFMIYAIPAAAIGGVPGGAALQVSIERVQRTYLATALLSVVCVLVYLYVGMLIAPLYLGAYGVISLVIGALLRALAIGYIALVLAKHYNDASYGRFY
jgi:hypothetical protein